MQTKLFNHMKKNHYIDNINNLFDGRKKVIQAFDGKVFLILKIKAESYV